VEIQTTAIPGYAASLAPLVDRRSRLEPPIDLPVRDREALAAQWLTLDAINFGSGWFPELCKRDELSGYNTIARYWREHHDRDGPFNAQQLTALDASAVAGLLGQDPGHELMALYAASLNDLGGHLESEYEGCFLGPVDAAADSAVALARMLGGWDCFTDSSPYDELTIPFLKRAQIAAADLHRAGGARFADLDRLTIFADNLVPHVLRLDGVLRFDPGLVARIDAEQLIAHDSAEEVEIRACALHAVELIVAALRETGVPVSAAEVDELLWNRGQQPRYKAVPRHRSRCTAY
jgi:hypothetical protein